MSSVSKEGWSSLLVSNVSSAEIIDQPVLETARLVLEPYKETDLQDILAYASHPDVAKYVPWEAHQSLDDSRSFLNYVAEKTQRERGKLFFVFAVRMKETGKVIGSIDFKNVYPHSGQIDYALGIDYWRKGIMSEAAMAVRDWAFGTLPELIRLQAFAVSDNVGSLRVMEKLGMVREGVRRKAFLLKGRPVDLVDYAIVTSFDWRLCHT